MNGVRGHPLLNSAGIAQPPTSLILPFFSFLASAATPSPSCPSSWLPKPPISAPSLSFPFSLQWLLSWFRRQMPCSFFFCISGVMNISLSCCNMIARQQALLCNVEHLFGVINKIAVFFISLVLYCNSI